MRSAILAHSDILCLKNAGAQISMFSHQMNVWQPWQLKKIKILGAVLDLPARRQCQSSPFTSKIGPNKLNWQCYLAGSSKTDFDFFSIAMVAKPSFYLKSISIQALAFFMHNNSSTTLFLEGSVLNFSSPKKLSNGSKSK